MSWTLSETINPTPTVGTVLKISSLSPQSLSSTQSPTKLALIRVLLTGYKSATDTPLTSPVSICTQTPMIMA